ncbi:unnamed protein product [Prunus armeniaca]|uniref:Uncharacterized protein n=1 Tax=Prunus armeniaca TaxID=36596 RepID=A0A6J5TI08_PRUAR|nr:unnamed protein product [Prunus armeniaca]
MGLLTLYETQDRRCDVLQMVAFVLWRIWKCRNEVVFNGVVVQAGDAVTILLKQVAEFNAAHVVDSTQGMAQNALAASGSLRPRFLLPQVLLSSIVMVHGRWHERFVLRVGSNGGGGGVGSSNPLLGIWEASKDVKIEGILFDVLYV